MTPDARGDSPRSSGADRLLGPLDRLTRRSSIRRVLLVILIVSLLPLGLLAAIQGAERLQRDIEGQKMRLADAARLTAARNRVAGAEAALHLLALNPGIRGGDPARCNALLADALRQYPAYSTFSRIGADGVVRCASSPAGVGRKVTDRALWAQMPAGQFAISRTVWGRVSNRPVLWAMLPLMDADGEFDGVVKASIDLAYLARDLSDSLARPGHIIVFADGRGRPVASSRAIPWQRFDISGPPGTIHDIDGPDGAQWLYAAALLHRARGVGESFHVLHVAPLPRRFGPEWLFAFGYFALPALALVLATIGIWIGANRAILRWVGSLGEMAQDIGRGEYRPREDDFHAAPAEIRALAAQLQRVARTISERDRTLTAALNEQRMLALELHHRVRNNLQIIGSFLSLQAMPLPRGPARQALDQARLRVSALALVHRQLYDLGELTTVSTESLLMPLAELIARQPGIAGHVRVQARIAAYPISIDAAVPLALWVIEAAMPLTLRGHAGNVADLQIILEAKNSELILQLILDGLGPMEAEPSGERLLHGTARQLSGRAEMVHEPGRSSACLTFPSSMLHGKPMRPFALEPGES